MDDATVELIERVDVYLEGLNEDVPPAEDLYELAARLAALQLMIGAKTGDAYEAQAADGFLCVELTCPARETDHRYGDEICGYVMEIRPKN